jgi:hypothetical protein
LPILIIEGTDLIYEGITTTATSVLVVRLATNFQEGTDLIYEGITTFGNMIRLFFAATLLEGTDLIYEGITTL